MKDYLKVLSDRVEELHCQSLILENRIIKHDEHHVLTTDRLNLFEKDITKSNVIINENKKGVLKLVTTTIEEQSAKVLKSIEQSRVLTEKVSSHGITLAEHDSNVHLNTEKLSILQKEVSAIYRDLTNLENIKMDRLSCASQFQDVK